jgi:hypothetical protein
MLWAGGNLGREQSPLRDLLRKVNAKRLKLFLQTISFGGGRQAEANRGHLRVAGEEENAALKL